MLCMCIMSEDTELTGLNINVANALLWILMEVCQSSVTHTIHMHPPRPLSPPKNTSIGVLPPWKEECRIVIIILFLIKFPWLFSHQSSFLRCDLGGFDLPCICLQARWGDSCHTQFRSVMPGPMLYMCHQPLTPFVCWFILIIIVIAQLNLQVCWCSQRVDQLGPVLTHRTSSVLPAQGSSPKCSLVSRESSVSSIIRVHTCE